MGCVSSKQQQRPGRVQGPSPGGPVPQPHPRPAASRPPAPRPAAAGPSVPQPTVLPGPPIMVPKTYRDASGRPIKFKEHELNSKILNQALGDVAAFLHQKKLNVRLVTVGGAVCTMLLGSRQSTGDVDFFLEKPQSEVLPTIHQAAQHANRKHKQELGVEWLNNATQLFMPQALQSELYRDAIAQNVIVFQQPGLTVYAASWSYAFCGKLNRIGTQQSKGHDLNDAVVFLQKYLQMKGLATIDASLIRRWCQHYGKNVNNQVLRQVNQAYAAKFKVKGGVITGVPL